MPQIDKPKIVLMVQSANTLFCYYNISPITLKEFTDKYGEGSLQNSKAALKVYSVDNGVEKELQTIFIDPFADNWYIHLDKGDIDVFVKLGRYLENNTFVEFAVSNIVTTPRLGESEDRRVYYIDVSEQQIPTKDNNEKREDKQGAFMKKGYVALVLHSHIPFIRHPEKEDALEERWLFEAMSECYIPLIGVYDKLIDEHIDFKITMSITPTLMAMLQDPYLNNKYIVYLKKSIELSEKEIVRNKNNKQLSKLAEFYNERFNNIYSIYKKYDYNLMNAFKKFDKLGYLEIITCSATHGLLPLLSVNPETVKAQLAIGIQYYMDIIGHEPKGIWLPECAYAYSLDSVLKEFGIRYFISENKAIVNASQRPKYGTYAPISTSNGICAFGRDMESSYQVWSSFNGYPGDYNYREFYRDIGYELPMDYIAPYIDKKGIRIDTGIKYYRVTGNTENKDYYNREMAMKKAKEHGEHFANSRHNQINTVSRNMDEVPIIVSPYDTELFGHWWFEGPNFIYEFIKKSSEQWTSYELTTPGTYLEEHPFVQCSRPCPSSWGENSDYSVWVNPSNDWIYRDLHSCGGKMIRLANTYKEPDNLEKRALNQAARELLLAESSDWSFIIKNNTTVQYAAQRINTHIERFNKLYEKITNESIDEKNLCIIEDLDNIFPNIDYKLYRSIN